MCFQRVINSLAAIATRRLASTTRDLFGHEVLNIFDWVTRVALTVNQNDRVTACAESDAFRAKGGGAHMLYSRPSCAVPLIRNVSRCVFRGRERFSIVRCVELL